MRRLSSVLACGALLGAAVMGAIGGCDSFSPSEADETDARADSAATPETGPGTGDAGADADAATLTTLYARSFGSADDAGDAGAAIFPSGMAVDPGGGVARSRAIGGRRALGSS